MPKGIRGVGAQLGRTVEKWGLREAPASAGQLFAHFGVETLFADRLGRVSGTQGHEQRP